MFFFSALQLLPLLLMFSAELQFREVQYFRTSSVCGFCTCLFPILQLKSHSIKNSEINYLSLQIFISSFKSRTKFTFKLYNLLVGNNKTNKNCTCRCVIPYSNPYYFSYLCRNLRNV